MQLELDLERGDRRVDEIRRAVLARFRAAGVESRLQAEIVALAASEARLVDQAGRKRLPLCAGERALARRLGASKSGVHEALAGLADHGLVTRGRGVVVVEWDRIVELEADDPLAGLPPTELHPPQDRSEGGRRVVGSLDPRNQERYSHHPSNQNHFQDSSQSLLEGSTGARPRARVLGIQLRWRHLFRAARPGEHRQRVDRAGFERLHAAAVRAGWVEAEQRAYTLALLLWIESPERVEAGVDRPLGWLNAALRDGPEGKVSWPGPEWFGRAEAMLQREEVQVCQPA